MLSMAHTGEAPAFIKIGGTDVRTVRRAEGGRTLWQVRETDAAPSLAISDAQNARIRRLDVYGRSTQHSLRGVNLVNLADLHVYAGGRFDDDRIGCYTVSGSVITARGQRTNCDLPGFLIPFDGRDITVSCTYGASMGLFFYRGVDADGGFTTAQMASSYTKQDGRFRAFISSERFGSDTAAIRIGVGPTDKSDYTIADIQAEYGTEPTAYEPYCGGMPSPNPAFPQEIVCAGGSVTAEGGGTSVSAPLPSPLRGVPLIGGYYSYANHTDASGTRWICDVLRVRGDGTGEIERRTRHYTAAEMRSMSWQMSSAYPGGAYINRVQFGIDPTVPGGLCTHLTLAFFLADYANEGRFYLDGSINFRVRGTRFPDGQDGWKAWLAENPMEFTGIALEASTEQLTAEQVAGFLALHTHSGLTAIRSTDGADIAVEYVGV